MIAYASRTGTRRNLDLLRKHDWRLMLSAKGVHRTEGFPYAIDNGAWWAYVNKQPFDDAAFLAIYKRFGAEADFVVLPDIVAGGLRSLEFSLAWRERLGTPLCPQLLAVQDGMEPADVIGIIGPQLGVFIGGTTYWKEKRMCDWARAAQSVGAWVHVGRVNTVRRIFLCAACNVHSFDGSSASRYALSLPKLENARQQEVFRWGQEQFGWKSQPPPQE